MKQAELAARTELQPVAASFARGNWQHAVGSSGTARALAEIMQMNGFEDGRITPSGIDRLRNHLIKAGDMGHVELAGLRSDRVPVLPGGLAIMNAALAELDIDSMVVATGAMRQGVLYDMLGRFHHQDMRDVTVSQFMQRYHVDALQARRVGALAFRLYNKLSGDAGGRTKPGCVSSPGLPSYTKSAFPSPTAATTGTRHTSSATPICRASRVMSKFG